MFLPSSVAQLSLNKQAALEMILLLFLSGVPIPELDIMTPDTVVIWTSIYFATSVIWFGISGVLLYGRLHNKHS
jgi:hypothetical protein